MCRAEEIATKNWQLNQAKKRKNEEIDQSMKKIKIEKIQKIKLRKRSIVNDKMLSEAPPTKKNK